VEDNLNTALVNVKKGNTNMKDAKEYKKSYDKK